MIRPLNKQRSLYRYSGSCSYSTMGNFLPSLCNLYNLKAYKIIKHLDPSELWIPEKLIGWLFIVHQTKKKCFFHKYFSCLIIIVRMIVYMNSFLINITNERLLTNLELHVHVQSQKSGEKKKPACAIYKLMKYYIAHTLS